MAETLGSLCDKSTIVKLKQWHTEDDTARESLAQQEKQLQEEMSEYIAAAINGLIPLQRLTFASNKVYNKQLNPVSEVAGNIGEVFAKLAEVNCKLWHEQEKVYDFEKIPPEEKNAVVKNLAILNLERNKCIDAIDRNFKEHVRQAREMKDGNTGD